MAGRNFSAELRLTVCDVYKVFSVEGLDDQLITRSGNAPTHSSFIIEHVWFCIRISAFGKIRAGR